MWQFAEQRTATTSMAAMAKEDLNLILLFISYFLLKEDLFK